VKTEADHTFQQLYDENHGRVHQLLVRIVGPQEAEDLTQVVFAKAARGLPKFRGAAQASTWLYRIAAHAASDWLRSRWANEVRVTDELPTAFSHGENEANALSSAIAAPASPERDMIRKEMNGCIRAAIGQLPEKQRTVLMLRELAGLPNDEVAETLGVSSANAKVRLHRARTELRKILQVRCDFSRSDDNEFVCEPKPTTNCATSKSSNCHEKC
jgi:RNA polymerase sigma-70 factor (ECF subfamily)